MHNKPEIEVSSSTHTPKVTVLMAVYNCADYLQSAIDSVLNQTFEDFEFIIINDGSSDSSVAIINSNTDPRIKVIHNEANLGLIGSLNKGIEAASGKYIARTDCDDLLEPERLRKQVAMLDQHDDIVILGSWMQLIDENGNDMQVWHYPSTDPEIRWASLFNTAIGHPSAMFRTEIAKQNFGYSIDFLYAEDYDLWTRLSEVGRLANIPEALQKYRIHGGSVSSRHDATQSDTRLSISKRSIKSLTQDDLDDTLIELITFYKYPRSRSELLHTIDGFETLYQAFVKRYTMEEPILRNIRWDIIERLSTAFHQLDWSDRLICLIKKYRIFPLKFWLKGRFLSFILGEQIKKIIRWAIGKKAYRVLRN